MRIEFEVFAFTAPQRARCDTGKATPPWKASTVGPNSFRYCVFEIFELDLPLGARNL
jgi:hypothetical protein